MPLHVCDALTKISVLLLFSSIASAQHLPSTPGFCGGPFCFEVAPVVRGGVLVKPTISLVVKPAGESKYEISYPEVGSISLRFQPEDNVVCESIKKKNYSRHFSTMICIKRKKVTSGLLEITAHGVNEGATVDVCEQALGAIWTFDTQALYINDSKPLGRKLEFTLPCK